MLTLLLLSSSPAALFDPKIILVVVLVSGEENDASSSSWCRCASSRGGGRGAGRTIGRRPRLLHISMNAPQERNTANRTWPGLMRSMLSDIASFLFPSLSLSLSLSRAQSVCLMCVFMKIPLGRFGVHKSREDRTRRRLLLLLLLFGEQEEKMWRVVVAKCFILFVAIYLILKTIRWSSSARLPSARRNSLSLPLSFLLARLRDRQLFLAKRRRIFRIIYP